LIGGYHIYSGVRQSEAGTKLSIAEESIMEKTLLLGVLAFALVVGTVTVMTV